MNATPFLIGNKTILRPVHPSDAPIFTRWMNDPTTRRYLLRRFPVTEMAEEAWIKKNAELSQHPTDLVFVIETKGDNKPIGTMGLHNINWRDRNATTGTILGEPESRGKGYATDAKMTLLEYAFETLGLHKIISHAFSANVKSVEYSKRCGYEVEAVHKDEIFREGRFQDLTVLACFCNNWNKTKEAMKR
ncbi:MAG: GNAT family N-acetyltransferase [Candidatus Pacebacteria bacterium]|nr:GNAT family N-acetyltransferase [Candidatus Paceibacterota bacterium]